MGGQKKEICTIRPKVLSSAETPRELPSVVPATVGVGANDVPAALAVFYVSHLSCEPVLLAGVSRFSGRDC